MPIEIEANGEIIEFPDGMPDQEIERILKEQLPQLEVPQQQLGQGQPPSQPLQTAPVDQPQDSSFGQNALGAIKNVAEGGVNVLAGVTEGLGDVFTGTVQSIAQLTGNQDFANKIGEEIAKQNASRNQSIPSKVGRFAGEVAPWVVGGGVAAGTKLAINTMSKVGKFLGGGVTAKAAQLATSGAVAGAGMGAVAPLEDPNNRSEAIGTSALFGSVGNVAAPVLGKGLKGAYNVIKKPFSKKTASEVLAKRLPANKTAEILEKLKNADPNDPAIIPDLAGNSIRGLTRAVSKQTPEAKDIITEALEGRSEDAVRRVQDTLSKDISDVDSYFGKLDDLIEGRKIIADPLYKKAFAQGTTLDFSKNKALFKKIEPDIKDARSKFRMGKAPAKTDKKQLSTKELNEGKISNNSLVMLDAAKRILDDKIGVAIRQGENQQSRVLLGIKKELVDKLDELNPYYKKARQVFSDFSSIKNAQESGLQFNKLRPQEIAKELKNMTQGEKDAYRIGVREKLSEIINKTSDGADPAKRIFGNTEIRNKLKAVIGNEKRYNDFKERMTGEIQAAKTKFEVLGGSKTDINQANEGQFLDTIANVGVGVATGGKASLIHAAVSSLRNTMAGLSKKNAKQLAVVLVNKEKGIEALEAILAREKSKTQKRIISEFIERLSSRTLATTQTEQ